MLRLVAVLLAASLLVTAAPAVAADGTVSPAAYNKKKCKKAKTKKQKKKYCKKKRPPQTQGQTQTQTGTQTQTTTPAQGTPTQTQTPSGTQTQVVRDDAGFTNALVGSRLNKTTEGTYGYGEYTWNFCAGGAWSYRSYYYAGSTVESNDGGSYQVVEGYHAAADPNYFGGIIQVSTTNGSQYRFGVELRGGAGFMKTNAKDFEEGTFTRQFGTAVC